MDRARLPHDHLSATTWRLRSIAPQLRERVAELGGQWLVPDRRGLSELEGFDREVLRSFSQRRNAIEAELERTGRSGPRASEAACREDETLQGRRRSSRAP